MSQPTEPAIRLLLDEMFSQTIADALRAKGHEVVALVGNTEMRAMPDEDVYAWAAANGYWLLTENVRDFRPIMLQCRQTGTATTGLLFTSSRTFPRSRQNIGPLVDALHSWLSAGPPPPPIIEDWLQPA
ncbi:DUF5615 family PIN-like protein [Actinoplanes sp. NPDC049316]|uniref:DUF5615 family PIN-like protein n=1 Tax=Actinoplanes sp. NPDC049316 TaxID=3154727 RepID=UPI0034341055